MGGQGDVAWQGKARQGKDPADTNILCCFGWFFTCRNFACMQILRHFFTYIPQAGAARGEFKAHWEFVVLVVVVLRRFASRLAPLCVVAFNWTYMSGHKHLLSGLVWSGLI